MASQWVTSASTSALWRPTDSMFTLQAKKRWLLHKVNDDDDDDDNDDDDDDDDDNGLSVSTTSHSQLSSTSSSSFI